MKIIKYNIYELRIPGDRSTMIIIESESILIWKVCYYRGHGSVVGLCETKCAIEGTRGTPGDLK